MITCILIDSDDVPPGFKIGVRHIQMMYMLASAISMGFIRGSMGVAVLAVIDPTRRDDTYIKVNKLFLGITQ